MAKQKKTVTVEETSSESAEGRVNPQPDVLPAGELIIYERDTTKSEKGVRNCQNRLERIIDEMVNSFAAEKAKELNLKPFYKGHRGGRYVYNNWKNWDGSRECYITVHLRLVVYFERPKEVGKRKVPRKK